jgi:hypothetical protein
MALAKGEHELACRKARALAGLLEAFRKKDAAAGLPGEIVAADALTASLLRSGFALPDRRQRRVERRERQRQEKIAEAIRTMVRRTAKSKPKPNGRPRLIYTPFESSRQRH